MKLFFVSITILISSFCFSQSKDETTVRDILQRQTVAWNNGNIEGFMQGYWQSDSLMFIGKSGITRGWTKTLNNYKKGYPDTAAMGKLDFTIIDVKRLSVLYFFVTA